MSESIFPTLEFLKSGDKERAFTAGGMTLRDYFAAKAMQGFLADSSQRLIREAIVASSHFPMLDDEAAVVAETNRQLAAGSYALADAMLAERAK